MVRKNDIGLVVVDPLVEMHANMDENSNTDMKEIVVRVLRHIAWRCNIPVLVVHHNKKSGASGDQDSARGGSAAVNACRFVVTTAEMAEEEAKRLGVEDRRRYVRVEGAKANYSAKLDDHWLRHIPVDQEDGDVTTGLAAADLATRTRIDWDTWERKAELLAAIEAGPSEGVRWSTSQVGNNRPNRATTLLTERFGLCEEAAKHLVLDLRARGVLADREYQRGDGSRKKSTGLFVA